MKAERARIEDNVKQPRKTIDTDSQEATSNKQQARQNDQYQTV